MAASIAARVAAGNGGWTRAELTDVIALGVAPDRAAELAGLILDAFPREPVDVRRTLSGYLAEMRQPMPPVRGIDGDIVTSALTGTAGARSARWAGLPALDTRAELAGFLDLTVDELDWFADHGNWLRAHAGPLQHYRTRRIAKRSGLRLLEIPKPRLREIQRKLLRHIVSGIEPHPAAHGFRVGRDARTFAAPHAGSRVVLRLDLRDFFARIRGAQVRAIFDAVGYPTATAALLADLCTTATPIAALSGIDPVTASHLRGRHLPQGAPTSPALSNLVLLAVDRRITGFVRRHELTYTRYADDIALSGDRLDPGLALWVIDRIVADAGHAVHPEKIRVMRSHQQQRLTGLVVNAHPQVSRREYDALRALLHNAALTGARAQNRGGHPHFREHVLGRIAWIGAGSPRRRARLLAVADQIDWER
jgi:retron-type reverse transcriptase